MFIASSTQHLLDIIRSGSVPDFPSMSVSDAREMVRQLGRAFDLPTDPGISACNLAFDGRAGRVAVRLYTPCAATAGPVVVYFHGGGWMTGDLSSHDSFCAFLTKELALRVVAVDYRLAPEWRFPSSFEDCLDAVTWVLGSPDEVGAPASHVALAGDSAGGGLAAAVALALAHDKAAPVIAQMLLYPVTDVVAETDSYTEMAGGFLLEAAQMRHFIAQYVPDPAMRRDPRCSPLLAESVDGAASLTLLTMGLDVLRDEGRAYAGRFVQAGIPTNFIEAAGYIHGLTGLRGIIPEASDIFRNCFAHFRADIGRAMAARPG